MRWLELDVNLLLAGEPSTTQPSTPTPVFLQVTIVCVGVIISRVQVRVVNIQLIVIYLLIFQLDVVFTRSLYVKYASIRWCLITIIFVIITILVNQSYSDDVGSFIVLNWCLVSILKHNTIYSIALRTRVCTLLMTFLGVKEQCPVVYHDDATCCQVEEVPHILLIIGGAEQYEVWCLVFGCTQYYHWRWVPDNMR